MGKDMTPVIEVNHVTKKFKLYYDRPQTLKERVVHGGKNAYREFLALDDVDFYVKRGSTVGLIGKNGCGKSTLLKIINRTMFANKGDVRIHGKVSSLIELGAGFHPELSGRENIYTNASIFGLTREEIASRIPDIIEFSELEEFIDNPIRTYSSGMYARLAFSVAIHVDADILLVDEILGVGDMNFQAKCANKIYEMRKSGMTIIMVSHDMSTIDRLCDYVIWIDHGKVIAKGEPMEIMQKYIAFMAGEQDVRALKEEKAKKEEKKSKQDVTGKRVALSDITDMGEHFGNGDVVFTGMRLLDENGVDKRSFHYGDSMTLSVDYICQNPEIQDNVNIGIEVYTQSGAYVFGINSAREGLKGICLGNKGNIIIQFNPVKLLPGEYNVGVATGDMAETKSYDHYHSIVSFRVYSEARDLGIVRLPYGLCVDDNWLKIPREE